MTTGEKSVEKLKKRALVGAWARSIGAAAVCMGATLFVGQKIITHYDDKVTHDLEAIPGALAQAEEDRKTAQTEQTRIEQRIGEACMTKFDFYITGSLHDVEEDSMVKDLLDEPGQPCGDSRIGIRNDFRSVKGGMAAGSELDFTIDQIKSDQAELSAEFNASNTDDYVGLALATSFIGIIGGIAGGLAGVVYYDDRMKAIQQ